MRTIKNLLRVLICAFCATLCWAFVACGGEEASAPFKLTLKDEAFRPSLYIEQEYTIDHIVEREAGATYEITELFYFDDAFEKHELDHEDGKFTQNAPFNVTIEITGSKNGTSDSVVVELQINYQTNPVIDALMASWNDEGVIRTLSAAEKYKTNGAKTAVVVRYMGTLQGMDGASYGNFIAGLGSCSVTDWSNAVVTMDVYNDTDYELDFGWQITKDKKTYQMELAKTTVPANSWGKIAWSLRAVGYNQDYFTSGAGSIGLKVKPGDSSQTAPFDFTFALCNIDVANYSAEKFPDLETRTIAEINRDKFDSLTGEPIDKAMVAFTTYTRSYDATTDTEVKRAESNSTASVKYTFTPNAAYANPTINRGNLLEADKAALGDYFPELTEWEDVRVSLWVKTNAKLNLAVRFRNTQDGETYRGASEMKFSGYTANKDIYASEDWQYIEWKLKDVYTLFTTDVTNWEIVLCNESVVPAGESISFYIDDFNVYSVSVPKLEGDADDIALYQAAKEEHSKYGSASTTVYTNEKYADNASLSKPTDLETNYYTKAVVSFTGNDGIIVPFLFDSMPEGYLDGTDYTNAYVGVWVYSANSAKVRFMIGDQCGSYPNQYEGQIVQVAANAWTWVEFSLADVGASKFGANIWVWQEAQEGGSTLTYYFDGFDIYTKTPAQPGTPDTPVVTGDADDTALLSYALEKHPSDKYDYATTTYKVVAYGEGDKPDTSLVENYKGAAIGNSYVEGTIVNSQNSTKDYISVPIELASGDKPVVAEGVDLTTAYIGFWLKTDRRIHVFMFDDWDIYVANAGETLGHFAGTEADANQWVYVELSLANIDFTGDYHVGLGINRAGVLSANETTTYQIDGLSIYNK